MYEKKDLVLILMFILFYSNPIQKIQIRWFLYKVLYSLTLRCKLSKKNLMYDKI